MPGVKYLKGKHQNVRTVLLHAVDYLPEVERTSDVQSDVGVDLHSVDVTIASDSPQVVDLGCVCEETHALVPSMPERPLSPDHQLILQELVEHRLEEIHPSVSPESALMVQDLMAHDIGDSGQLAERRVAVFVEVD